MRIPGGAGWGSGPGCVWEANRFVNRRRNAHYKPPRVTVSTASGAADRRLRFPPVDGPVGIASPNLIKFGNNFVGFRCSVGSKKSGSFEKYSKKPPEASPPSVRLEWGPAARGTQGEGPGHLAGGARGMCHHHPVGPRGGRSGGDKLRGRGRASMNYRLLRSGVWPQTSTPPLPMHHPGGVWQPGNLFRIQPRPPERGATFGPWASAAS